MAVKSVVLDLDQIKVIEKLVTCVTKPGLINLDTSDIQKFLKHGKKLIYKTATITEATKEAVEKSGLLCDELHYAHKYCLNIESGKNITLEDISTIASAFHDFEERPYFAFGTTFDEYKEHEILIDLFILE